VSDGRPSMSSGLGMMRVPIGVFDIRRGWAAAAAGATLTISAAPALRHGAAIPRRGAQSRKIARSQPTGFPARTAKLLNARDFLFPAPWPADCKRNLARPSCRACGDAECTKYNLQIRQVRSRRATLAGVLHEPTEYGRRRCGIRQRRSGLPTTPPGGEARAIQTSHYQRDREPIASPGSRPRSRSVSSRVALEARIAAATIVPTAAGPRASA
jgi:hypothetical protein